MLRLSSNCFQLHQFNEICKKPQTPQLTKPTPYKKTYKNWKLWKTNRNNFQRIPEVAVVEMFLLTKNKAFVRHGVTEKKLVFSGCL